MIHSDQNGDNIVYNTIHNTLLGYNLLKSSGVFMC